jgi:hypothetical protein
VVIDFEQLDAAQLPVEVAVSSITLAELATGPHATDDPEERARRQNRLQRTEAALDPIPFDSEAARAYGRVYAAVVSAGRNERRPRAVDLLPSPSVIDRAARYAGPDLRSSDAIHLATAEHVASLANEALEAFVTYDERLLAAARGLGLPVVAPGAP